MPSVRTISDWRKKDEVFSAAVARARDIGFDVIAEDCLAIADDDGQDTITRYDRDGNEIGKSPNGEWIARSKLRVETRMKLLACWDPRRYGNKLQVGEDEDRPLRSLSDVERAARLEAILAAAAARRDGAT